MLSGSERTSQSFLILGTLSLGLRASKALTNALDTLGSRITKFAVMLDVAIIFPPTPHIIAKAPMNRKRQPGICHHSWHIPSKSADTHSRFRHSPSPIVRDKRALQRVIHSPILDAQPREKPHLQAFRGACPQRFCPQRFHLKCQAIKQSPKSAPLQAKP